MQPITVVALYKFVALPDFEAMRERILQVCRQQDIRGTILLAREGMNGTIAGRDINVANVLDFLKSDPRLDRLQERWSYCDVNPFLRMKVRLKREIVTLGVPDIDPARDAGTYVDPRDWNELVTGPDTILIDTRNDYEVAIGSFAGAIDPKTSSFRDFPQWVQDNRDLLEGRKLAMFCTGGIRCEKATAFLKKEGYRDVFHLKGGILGYLESIPEQESLWRGECFVFDERVSVRHGLAPGEYALCHACRRPVSPEERKSPYYVEGISCPHCHEEVDAERRRRFMERQKQIELARQRGLPHIAADFAEAKARKQRQRELSRD